MIQNQRDKQMQARAQKVYAESKPANATPSRTILNSSAVGQYKPPAWHVRAGADDHIGIGSRGYV